MYRSITMFLLAASLLALLAGCRTPKRFKDTSISTWKSEKNHAAHTWIISVEGTPGVSIRMRQFIQQSTTNDITETSEIINIPFRRELTANECYFDFQGIPSSPMFKKPHEVYIRLTKNGDQYKSTDFPKDGSPFRSACIGTLTLYEKIKDRLSSPTKGSAKNWCYDISCGLAPSCLYCMVCKIPNYIANS